MRNLMSVVFGLIKMPFWTLVELGIIFRKATAAKVFGKQTKKAPNKF